MGWWRISTDTLAGSRFVVSPLAEATAALFVLHRATAAHPGEREWLNAHLPAYRERLAGDPVTALLIRTAFGRNWTADFLTPPPRDAEPAEFGMEVARVRETPTEVALADLTVTQGGRPLAPVLVERDDLPERAARLLEWVWTHAVEPTWPRRRRIIEADIVARTEQLSHGGWAAALGDLRPGMRWLGDGRLQINASDHPPKEITEAWLSFVPVTFMRSWTSWDLPSRYALIYPCSGALAETGERPTPEALEQLLGNARARVLVLLDAPKSTTQLVALTGQGLGSVGRHLKVLLDAQLIQRRRSGRSVLYYRTATGDALVKAQSRAG